MNPAAPDHLDARGRAKWQEVYPLLVERHGDVNQGLRDALTAYCVAWASWLTASEKATEAPVIETPQGAVISPWARLAEQHQRQLRQWHTVLRLGPPRANKVASSDPVLKLVQRQRKA